MIKYILLGTLISVSLPTCGAKDTKQLAGNVDGAGDFFVIYAKRETFKKQESSGLSLGYPEEIVTLLNSFLGLLNKSGLERGFFTNAIRTVISKITKMGSSQFGVDCRKAEQQFLASVDYLIHSREDELVGVSHISFSCRFKALRHKYLFFATVNSDY